MLTAELTEIQSNGTKASSLRPFESMDAFVKYLGINAKSILEIDLSRNNINLIDATALAKAIEHNITLTSINLRGNQIGNDGATALATALWHNSTLTSIDLEANKIYAAGATALAIALKHNSTLTRIDLNDTAIAGHGAIALIIALGHNEQKIFAKLKFAKLTFYSIPYDNNEVAFKDKVLEIAPCLIKHHEAGLLTISSVYELFKKVGYNLNASQVKSYVFEALSVELVQALSKERVAGDKVNDEINAAMNKLVEFESLNPNYAGDVASLFLGHGMINAALYIIENHSHQIKLSDEAQAAFFLTPYPKSTVEEDSQEEAAEFDSHLKEYHKLFELLLGSFTSPSEVINALIHSAQAMNAYGVEEIISKMDQTHMKYTIGDIQRANNVFKHMIEIAQEEDSTSAYTKTFLKEELNHLHDAALESTFGVQLAIEWEVLGE